MKLAEQTNLVTLTVILSNAKDLCNLRAAANGTRRTDDDCSI
jgi:hypothetical protein